MLPDSHIVKRAKKVVDAGTIPLAQLSESIFTNEKLDALLAKEAVIPEINIPEPLSSIEVSNLPEIQKVEVTNLPEKDDKEIKKLLKELIGEVKKKEEYAYDIEIDPTLKEQLKGKDGVDGIDGKTPVKGEDYFTDKDIEEIVNLLKKKEPIVIDDVRGLREILQAVSNNQGGRAFEYLRNLVDVSSVTPTNGQVLAYNTSTQKWEPTTPSGGGATISYETVSKNLNATDATFNYTGGILTSVVYTSGITKTFNYTSGSLTSVVLSGSTPGGIDLTKTLSYTSGTLTNVTYS